MNINDQKTCNQFYSCSIVILVVFIVLALIYIIYVNYYEKFLDVRAIEYEGSNYHNDNYWNANDYPQNMNFMRYKMANEKW